jgi:polysaccharide biosynthesis protein PslH
VLGNHPRYSCTGVRILIVTPELPLPPLTGLRLQLMHVCKELGDEHEVCVVGFRWEDQVDGRPPNGTEIVELAAPPRTLAYRALNWAEATGRHKPVQTISLNRRASRAVEELLRRRRFDVVHVASAVLAGIVPALNGTPAVLSALDAWHLNVLAGIPLYSPVLRPLIRLEARRVRRFESRALHPYQRVVMVSQRDAGAIRALDPTLRPDVIPNGVDAEFYAPAPSVERDPGSLVFTGVMNWSPNVAAAIHLAWRVFPEVRRRRPQAHLLLVGRRPNDAVRKLDALEGVRVTGAVPDVRPWLHRAHVYVCPMVSGTGIKNKLLEAMACGVPTVATSLACEGTIAKPGEHLLVADTDEGLVAAIVELIDDPAACDRLAAAGRRYVVEEHSWKSVAAAYEQVYREAIAS